MIDIGNPPLKKIKIRKICNVAFKKGKIAVVKLTLCIFQKWCKTKECGGCYGCFWHLLPSFTVLLEVGKSKIKVYEFLLNIFSENVIFFNPNVSNSFLLMLQIFIHFFKVLLYSVSIVDCIITYNFYANQFIPNWVSFVIFKKSFLLSLWIRMITVSS